MTKRLEVAKDLDEEECRQALKSGKAVQFYEFDWKTATERHKACFPDIDVWYTERNGDPITMLVPAGTPKELLPDMAMEYIAFRWDTPENF